MPLHILLILVMGGIALIAVLLHLLGLSHADPLDPDSARRAWLRHYPDHPPSDIVISRDGRAALIETEQGAGLLWRFGADTVARLLTAPRVCPASSGLRVRFADPGTPGVTLRLDDRERPLWAQRLEQVT